MKPLLKDDGKVVPIVVPTPYDVGDVNMYVFEDRGKLTLIDATVDTDASWELLIRVLSEHDWSLSDISQVWLTHHHQDHIGLVNRLVSTLNVPVYAHLKALSRLRRDPGFLLMRVGFFERLYQEMGCGAAGERQVLRIEEAMHRNAEFAIRTDVLPLREGDAVDCCDVIEVPGHAPDQIAFWNSSRRWLFAGDHLIGHISSNAFVEPDSHGERIPTLVEYAASLVKCSTLDAEFVFSGHGEWIQDHKKLIERRLKRIEEKAERIVQHINEGATNAYELAQVMYPSKYDSVFAPVMSEVIGLLDYLEHKSNVQKRLKKGIWRYSC